jgi:predicted transcriptional regulator
VSISVLLSIKPEFVEKIFDGSKKFEFRRSLFKEIGVQRIIVYASSPVQKVVGEFEIDNILSLKKNSLWRKTYVYAGISKSFFDQYFDGKDIGHAIQIGKVIKYKQPLCLNHGFGIKHPPQSFAYVRTPSATPCGPTCRSNPHS